MKYLCQSAQPWRDQLLGLSTITRFKNAACLITAMGEALRQLGLDAAATPRTVQHTALVRWRKDGGRQAAMPFIKLPLDEKRGREPGANAVTVEVGAANGLRIGPRIDAHTAGLEALIGAVEDAFRVGGRALMHVDTDANDADFNGKHWVLVVGFAGRQLLYADPATGGEGQMALASLRGRSGWSSGREFVARGVRQVHAL